MGKWGVASKREGKIHEKPMASLNIKIILRLSFSVHFFQFSMNCF